MYYWSVSSVYQWSGQFLIFLFDQILFLVYQFFFWYTKHFLVEQIVFLVDQISFWYTKFFFCRPNFWPTDFDEFWFLGNFLLTHNLLTIASFRIRVPSNLLKWTGFRHEELFWIFWWNKNILTLWQITFDPLKLGLKVIYQWSKTWVFHQKSEVILHLLFTKISVLSWIDVFCLPVGLYSILNPVPVVQDAVSKWTIISFPEDMWLGGIEAPQYFPIMGDVLEPPS